MEIIMVYETLKKNLEILELKYDLSPADILDICLPELEDMEEMVKAAVQEEV